MSDADPNNLTELLVGTWIGVAIVADVFVRAGILRRSDFAMPLSRAEAMAKDSRHIALSALRRLIEGGFAEPEKQQHPHRRASDKVVPFAVPPEPAR